MSHPSRLLDRTILDLVFFCIQLCFELSKFQDSILHKYKTVLITSLTCVPHLLRMATMKISTGYYTVGKSVTKKRIKNNSIWYINTTEEIQSDSHHFKFQVCFMVQCTENNLYFLTVTYLKPKQFIWMENKWLKKKGKKSDKKSQSLA
jgi:hypothetical protein